MIVSRLTLGFAGRDPERFARLLEAADEKEAAEMLEALSDEAAGQVASHLSLVRGGRVLGHLTDELLVRWLDSTQLDTAARVLARASPERSVGLVRMVGSRNRRIQLTRLLEYPQGSIGALVRTEVLTVNLNERVQEVVEVIRRNPGDEESPVVVLDDGVVIGVLDLRRLVAAEDHRATVDGCYQPVQPLLAETPVSAALALAAWREHPSLPVVDYQGRLLGYVTYTATRDLAAADPQSGAVIDAGLEVALRFLEVLSELLVFVFGGRRPSSSLKPNTVNERSP